MWFMLFVLASFGLFANAFSKAEGPNCLNTALLFNRIVPYARYTSNTEFDIILKSSLCRPLQVHEERKLGDIHIILGTRPTSQKGLYSHAYVFLKGDDMFEKVGSSQKAPYRVVKESEIFEDYQVGEFSRVEGHRCHPLKRERLKERSRIVLEKMEALEKELSSILGDESRTRKPEVFFKIKSSVREIAKALQDHENDLVFKIVLGRIVSLGQQLHILGENSLWEVTRAWEFSSDNLEGLRDQLTSFEEVP
jgi:hypothetical protein